MGVQLPGEQTSVVAEQGTFFDAHSVIMPDVTIGNGCVIGGGSVVTRDVPDYSVAVRFPAHMMSTFERTFRVWCKCDSKSASAAMCNARTQLIDCECRNR